MLQGGAAVQGGAVPQGMAPTAAAAAAETRGKGLEGMPKGAQGAARWAGEGWGRLAAWGEVEPWAPLEGLAGCPPLWALAEDLWPHQLLQQSICSTAQDFHQRDHRRSKLQGSKGRLGGWTLIGCPTVCSGSLHLINLSSMITSCSAFNSTDTYAGSAPGCESRCKQRREEHGVSHVAGEVPVVGPCPEH